jgi:hypothetical protein
LIGFRPGRAKDGKPDLHIDGEPAWWESTCGRYTVSRDHREDRRQDVFFAWVVGQPPHDIPGKYRSLDKASEAVNKWDETHREPADVAG